MKDFLKIMAALFYPALLLLIIWLYTISPLAPEGGTLRNDCRQYVEIYGIESITD